MRTAPSVRWLLIGAAALLAATACSGGAQQTTTTSAAPTTTTQTTSATTTEAAATAAHRFDYSAGPIVWFQPLPPLTDPSLPFQDGSIDYSELFPAAAPWTTAASRVDVFGVYATWVRHYATDDELGAVIEYVTDHGMALAMEVGPLPSPRPDEGCVGAESYGGSYEIEMMQRIGDLGGTVDVIAFDEAYAFGHKADGPTDCRRPVERVAAEAADFTRMAREVNPDVIVGSIEPMWAQPEIGVDDMAAWLDAYRDAAGEPLAFLHLDSDWSRPDWAQVLYDVEQVADARGVPVGIIYFGDDGARSDATWTQLAAERMYVYEQVLGGSPDDVVIQSWDDHPDHTLPDTDPTTLTGLVNRYFGARTVLDVASFDSSAAGTLSATGSLATVDGDPIADALLLVEGTPRDGQQQTLSATGQVPEGATRAVIVVRVNAENAGPATADIRLYDVSYTENAGGNLTPDPRFADGGWTPYGAGTGEFPASDHGAGRMLQLTADPDQDLFVDSRVFAVTPGAPFTFSVTDSVPEGSVGSGFIAVVFLAGDAEVSRTVIPFEPVAGVLGTGTTDAAGSLVIDLTGIEAGTYRLRISYPGDLTHWVAHTDADVEVG
jgi:hypothetical protein